MKKETKKIECPKCKSEAKKYKSVLLGIIIIFLGMSWVGHLPSLPFLPFLMIIIGILYLWRTPEYRCKGCKHLFNQKDI